ncbi:NAD-dependent epimerase/dehydratase family protein [Vibrio metschnikovii]|uniref:NAD-dependent epimerase/dehydratase family protein n=1 Tax=Vibrio metschnikovii TaxID=28172 RepID=UPI002A0C38DD|nr:NAD(P)H-binding protein [Vibrio metschnikovii]
MQRIAIIGAGWLGQPLIQHLKQQNYYVCASRTSLSGVEQLHAQGVDGFVCQLPDAPQLVEALLNFRCDALIGCFPPGFRKGHGTDYQASWQTLVNAAQQAGIRKIIMISSTSVYPDQAETMREEDASLVQCEQNSMFSEKAKIMLCAEQAVIDSGIEYAILRCSGLIGPNRHPARFALRLSQVSDQAPANMVHQYDVLQAITFSLSEINNHIINVTTPTTVSKAEFYRAALSAVQSPHPLPPIVHLPDKRIVSDKLITMGFHFHYANTLEALHGYE